MENGTTISIKPLLSAEDLSKILGYEVKTIYDLNSKRPDALPPRLKLFKNARALRWHPEVVDAWIRERAGLPVSPEAPLPVQKRGPGRPRKEGGVK